MRTSLAVMLIVVGGVAACDGGGQYRTSSPRSSPPTSALAGHLDAVAQISAGAPSVEFTAGELSGAMETTALAGEVAVRHRLVPTSLRAIVARPHRVASAPDPAQPAVSAVQPAAAGAKLVVEGWLTIVVGADVRGSATAIRARVAQAGGSVVSETIEAAHGRVPASATLELRVPPARTGEVTGWLATLGTTTSERSLATDVSRHLVDDELALANLHVALARLQELAKAGSGVADLLAVERELTRVRGDIERLEGEQRFLVDRVELATITVTLRGAPVDDDDAGNDDDGPSSDAAQIYPGARASVLHVVAGKTRFGGGGTIRVHRWLTLDLDLYPRANGEGRAAVATLGSALYSGRLGGGRRRWLNPYLGLRAGYARIDGRDTFAIGAELGIEIVKVRNFLVEVSARSFAFAGDGATSGAVAGLLGVAVPF